AVLRRRADVAWRAMLTLALGLAAGITLLVVGAGQQWCPPQSPAQSWCLGEQIRTYVPGLLVRLVEATLGNLLRLITGSLTTLTLGSGGGADVGTPLNVPLEVVDGLYSALAALLATSLTIPIIGRLVARPSPLAFQRESPVRQSNAGAVLWWSAVAIA